MMDTSTVTAAPVGTQELNPDALMAAAGHETGLDDFGSDEFSEYLARFLSAAVAEGNLNEMGVISLVTGTHRLLVNRLRFEEDLERHPEILDEDVSDPIVV